MSTNNHKLRAVLLHFSDTLLEVVDHFENNPVNDNISKMQNHLSAVKDSLKQLNCMYVGHTVANLNSVARLVEHVVSSIQPSVGSANYRENRSYRIEDIPASLTNRNRETIETDVIRISGARSVLHWIPSLHQYLTQVITAIGKQIDLPPAEIANRIWVSQHLIIGQNSLPENVRVGVLMPIKEGMPFNTLDTDRVIAILSISIWANLVSNIFTSTETLTHSEYLRIVKSCLIDTIPLKRALATCWENNESIRALFTEEGVDNISNEKMQVISLAINEYLNTVTLTRLFMHCTSCNPLLNTMGITDNLSSGFPSDANGNVLTRSNIFLDLLRVGDFQMGILLKSGTELVTSQSTNISQGFLVCHSGVESVVRDHCWAGVIDPNLILNPVDTRDGQMHNAAFLRKQVFNDTSSEAHFFNPFNLKEDISKKINTICERVSHTLLRISI